MSVQSFSNPGCTRNDWVNSSNNFCCRFHSEVASTSRKCKLRPVNINRSVPHCKMQQGKSLPSPTYFRKLWWPRWSSRVSCRDPGPISLVLLATWFNSDQLRLIPSPSVLPTPGLKLREWGAWHGSLCIGQ